MTGIISYNMEETLDKIVELRKSGLSAREIGKCFGRGRTWARTRLREVGLESYYYDYFKPTERQQDLLVGTVLGDGSLRPSKNGGGNAHLHLGHCSSQKDYLCWKVNQLGTLFKTPPPLRLRINKSMNNCKSYHCHSRQHPWLTEWHHLFYPDGRIKVITEEILSLVNNFVLAIWWCDDGSTYRSDRFIGYRLCAGNLIISEYELIYSWFSTQGFDPYPASTNGNCVNFRFRKKGSLLFRERIKPYIPESMLFKFNRHLGSRYLA